MRAIARAFLSALDADQRAAAWARFDVPDHHRWTYLPGERPGVMLGDLAVQQRRLVVELIETGCSERGATDTRDVLWTEAIRDALPQTLPGSDADEFEGQRYWVRILGDPADEVWAWRINGHHLALHLTVVGDSVAATPHFFGAQPATFFDGPYAGRRTLAAEEDVARELLRTLEPGQREVAVVSPMAPRDIQTRYDPVADPGRIRPGLAYGDMSDPQRRLLTRLMRQYIERVRAEPARRSWQDIVDAGIERVTFCWAGGAKHGQEHYYAVAGPTFLIEYDNTQQDANHIHSVWRDLRNDWGADLLAAHYAAERH
jgi:Protein of unknown function (DUF3500)